MPLVPSFTTATLRSRQRTPMLSPTAMSFFETLIRKGEGASVDDYDWVSEKCGLSRMVSKKDKTVAWVSDDATPKFNKEGKAVARTNSSRGGGGVARAEA